MSTLGKRWAKRTTRATSKVEPEIYADFQTVCRLNKSNVSDTLRKFMIDQVQEAKEMQLLPLETVTRDE